MAEETESIEPRTAGGGFAAGETAKFGGGSESPGHADADAEWRGEAPGEDDKRAADLEAQQAKREQTTQDAETA